MPELPEVEVMAQKLHGWAAGKKILAARVLRQNKKYHPEGLEGQVVTGRIRRGKRLFLTCEDGNCLSVHQAMSGYWDASDDPWTFDYVEGKRAPSDKDVRVEIDIDGGRTLRFHDQRLFGSMKVMSSDEVRAEVAGMGPEAIKTPRMFCTANVMNLLDLAVGVGADKRPIKQILLDQSTIAGVGNIYAAESLWMSRIHPCRQGVSLTTSEVAGLSEALQRVLNGALERDLCYDGLMVYRRKECGRCSGPIGKVEIAKRATYFCPACQKENG